MTMKNKIALIMLMTMTSILTITSMTSDVYAELPRDPTVFPVKSMDHSIMLGGYAGGWSMGDLPILSFTWEYSYDGTFIDMVPETILTDTTLHESDRGYMIHTIENLEAGHEYSIRIFTTNADGDSIYSNVITMMPASGTYILTMDSVQYTNGTDFQSGDTVQTNSTLIFLGTFLKNDQSFSGQEIHIEFYNWIVEDTIRVGPFITLSDGTWNGTVDVNLPMDWDINNFSQQIGFTSSYIDEFDINHITTQLYFMYYEFVIADGQCQEGYEPEIIDEDGSFFCHITNEWHDSEMLRMQSTIDKMAIDNALLIERQRICGEGTIQEGSVCVVDVSSVTELSNEPYAITSSIVYLPDEMYCGKLGSSYDKIIIGTDGNDRIDTVNPDSEDLKSTRGNDLIFAGAGHDYIRAGNGDDCIYGGAGDDIIDGSRGNDVIYGEDGDDSIKGQDDLDIINGGYGFDICIAELVLDCE